MAAAARTAIAGSALGLRNCCSCKVVNRLQLPASSSPHRFAYLTPVAAAATRTTLCTCASEQVPRRRLRWTDGFLQVRNPRFIGVRGARGMLGPEAYKNVWTKRIYRGRQLVLIRWPAACWST